MPRRIVFDIRTLVESKGNKDGIVRTVHALARYAADRPDVMFAIFDVDHNAFRPLRPQWIGPVFDGAKVDTTHFADPFGKRPRLRERLPLPLKRVALAIQRPRRRALLLVTRLTLIRTKPSPWLNRLQAWLTSAKYRDELTDPTGHPRLLVPFEVAMGAPVDLSRDDVVFLAGSDWSAMHRIAAFVAKMQGPRLAVLCHDIIPLLYPDFFRPIDVNRFRACFHAIFPVADLVVLTTRRIEADVRAYCQAQGLGLGRTSVIGLGADFTRVETDSSAALPHDLRSDHYALFVSTVEPRKNHRLLFAVWKRLWQAGLPQRHGFRLVFVGRRGWLMQDFIDEMKAHPSYGEGLLLLSNIDDATLAALYAGAAFCLYPSFYEGFGLPVLESFRYGKAVIASTGGALPEVAQDFSPLLDPRDENGWYAMLAAWIEDPSARTPYEDAIRKRFSPRSWNDASRDLFEAIEQMPAKA